MNKESDKKEIFLDQLNWESFLFLFFKNDIQRIWVLDKIKFQNYIFKIILNLKGLFIKEKPFFAGNLLNHEQKSLWILAVELSDKLAFQIADISTDKSSKLNSLNSKYGNNTIRLFIAKNYKPKLVYWILRGLISKNFATSNTNSLILCIKDPIIFDKSYLNDIIDGISFSFYHFRNEKIVLLKYFLLDYLKFTFKNINYKLFQKINLKFDLNLNSVLSYQEESIRLDQSLRNQYSWHDLDKHDKHFNSFVIENSFAPNRTRVDIDELSGRKNYVLPQAIFGFAKRKYKNHFVRKLINKEIRSIKKTLFNKNETSEKYLLLKTLNLLKYSDSLACLCLLLNTKVFLIKEPQYITSDAIQIVSSFIKVKTICIQYSNMSRPSPMSMSTCDEFLIFSSNYKKVFKTKNISPKKFIETGYSINGIQSKLNDRVNKIKTDLKEKNVSFIIGFFDESVSNENDKWGFIHPKNHLSDIHILAKAVIEDCSLAVIIKNQFTYNDLNKIFPEDKLIKKATATKRFISISEGNHRNDIYPMQIALVSDFCINYKFGATAGIESAITGTRTVLVDKFNYDSAHDDIYSKANIIYNDFKKLIMDISELRSNKGIGKNLGDWNSIIHYFDPFSKRIITQLKEIIKL